MHVSDIQTALFLARKSLLRGSRAVLFLTPFVIGLAVTNLVFFTGLFAGITQAVDRLVIESLFSNVLVEPEQDHPYITSADGKLKLTDQIPGVMASAPHYKSTGLFSFDPDKDNRDVMTNRYTVTSIEPDREAKVTRIKDYIVEGRYLIDSDRDAIVIGAEVAGRPDAYFPKASLGGVHVGDNVRVTYINGISHEYEVVGIFKVGSDVIDLGTYVTHKELESVLGVRDSAHEIMVRTQPGIPEGAVINELRARVFTKEKLSSWQEFLNYTATLRQSFTFLNVVTSIVSMIVVNVTVFIVIFINVVNKRKQLGILRAMGVPETTITLSYLFQTLFACLIGIAFSCFLSFLVLVPYFHAHPLNVGFGPFSLVITAKDMAFSGGIVMLTNTLAGFIPAVWAIRRESIIKSIWGV